MDYCIRKLLGLIEKNFIPDEHWLEVRALCQIGLMKQF